MKYIYTDSKGTHFDQYFEYIKSLRSNIPQHVFEFASNPKHYDLSNHSSLHDSWLEHLEISESSKDKGTQKRETKICVRLLGPFHDRHIYLEYRKVKNYCVSFPNGERNHGDLLVHEVRIGESGFLIHELVFENGKIIVECENIKHSEQLHENA